MQETLNNKTKILYGIAGIGDSALYNFMGTFGLFYFTTMAGINPAIAGTIVAVGAVWDVVCSSIVGYLSDRTRSRYGKRKPFMLVVAFPMAVVCSLVFVAIDASQTVRCIYYMVMVMLFWTGYSVFYVPYTTWGSELTDDYEERTSLRGIVYVFYIVGAVFSTVLPTIVVDFLVQAGASRQTGWFTAAVAIGVGSGAAIFFSAWFIKRGAEDNRADTDAKADQPAVKKNPIQALVEIIKNYYEVLKFRTARYIILASMFYLVGVSIQSGNKMYYYTYVMDLSPKMISFVMFFQMSISACFVPVLNRVNRYLDKRTICIGGLAIASISSIIYGFTGIPDVKNLLIVSLFYGMGSICYWQLIPSMLYDTCDADRLENRIERAGIIISFQSLAESVSEAVGFQLLGAILGVAGFVSEAAVQSETTLRWMHISFTFMPALFTILAMLMVIKYPITRRMHAQIQRQLKEQK